MAMADMKEQSKKGTRGNNKASFTKDGINGETFEIWTEEKANEMIDKLERWMKPTIIYKREGEEGEEIETDEIDYIMFDPDKIFFKDFLIAHGLYASWLKYVSDKYETVSKRIRDLKEMQEQLIVRASARGKIKEKTAQFILMQWYDWRTKTDNANTQIEPVVWNETKKYVEKK